MITPVTWLAAPDWLTPVEAAFLMGCSEEAIRQLADMGAIVSEEVDGALLIEKRELYRFRESLWEVLGNEQEER